MKNIFGKIFMISLLTLTLFGITYANGDSNISSPKFNDNWNIEGGVYRVCWGLPQHAIWDTEAANSSVVTSIYGDVMPVAVDINVQSQLLGILTPRNNFTKCPIKCDEGYTLNTTTVTCEKTNVICEEGYTKIDNECFKNSKTVEINTTTCSNNITPEHAHYKKNSDTITLQPNGTYSSLDCSWICDDNYITNGNNQCIELTAPISLSLSNEINTDTTLSTKGVGDATVISGVISSNARINVTSLEIETNTGISNQSSLMFILKINGVLAKGSFYTGEKVVLKNLGEINYDSGMKIELIVEPNLNEPEDYRFYVKVKGIGPNSEDIESSVVVTNIVHVVEPIISLASNAAKSEVKTGGSNISIFNATATVSAAPYDLFSFKTELENPVPQLNNQYVTLLIDGTSAGSVKYDGGNYFNFPYLNGTLDVGQHKFEILGNFGDTPTLIETKKVYINEDFEETINHKIFIVGAYPVISASTSSNDLILKIENPKGSTEDIEILGFLVDGEVINASIYDSMIDLSSNTSLNALITAKSVSICSEEYVEFRIQAAKSATVQVKGIIIRVDGQELVINSDYTNVGTWSHFKVTANGDMLPANYYELTSGTDDTTITAHTN